MKNHVLNLKSRVVLVLTILLCMACADLNEEPEGMLSPATAFTSKKSLEAAVIGIYYPFFNSFNAFDFYIFIAGGAGADDIASDNSVIQPYDRLTPISNRINESIWASCYEAITNANVLIGNARKVPGVPQEELDEYIGQARFLRAFGYFFLTRYFGEVPLITFENQMNADTVRQSPVARIYDLMIEDLKFAEEKLPVSFPQKGKATQGAAKTLLAKVYLTMAGWPLEQSQYYALARDKAREVMDAKTYGLLPDYADLWKASLRMTNQESIFTFFGLAGKGWRYGSHLHLTTRPSSEGGWGDFYSDSTFFKAFPTGYRKTVSFYTTIAGKNWREVNPKQPFIAKYRDAGMACGATAKECEGDGEAAVMIFRYAEVLLIYAEAANRAEGGPSTAAYDALNQVRRRAQKLPVNTPDATVDLAEGLSQQQFDKEVIAERAWELAFENKRWFDLVRRKMVVQINEERYPNVSANDRLIPKPALQVSVTKGLDQNPGY